MKHYIIDYLEETGWDLVMMSSVYYCTLEMAIKAAKEYATQMDGVVLYEGKVAPYGGIVHGDKISDFPPT